MNSVLNHVALLVPNVLKAAEYLRPFGFKIGPAEKWEGEGTLEIYVGDPSSEMGRLLLMEPVKEGAYTRAMEKRGPGLHHIAIDVLDLESFIDQISGSGWLLHPKSLKTIKQTQTAYLARPGIPTLIEIQQRESLCDSAPFVSELHIPNLSEKTEKMFRGLGLTQICPSKNDNLIITIQGRSISATELYK